ncbi:MAG: class I SAM-dependent methyltransferase, partial [Chloroflexi bacterium]|nr:class I SAM-dependent methyltransferase [Chloroflexota bacterium]
MDENHAAHLTREILSKLLIPQQDPVSVRLWDGTFWPDETPRPATLVLKHPGALRAMF